MGGKIIRAIAVGTVLVQDKVNARFVKRPSNDVSFVPDLGKNLLSITAVTDKDFSFLASKNLREFRDQTEKISSIGLRHGNLYRMQFKVIFDENTILQINTHIVQEKVAQRRIKKQNLTLGVKLMADKKAERANAVATEESRQQEEIGPFTPAVSDDVLCNVLSKFRQQTKPPDKLTRVTELLKKKVFASARKVSRNSGSFTNAVEASHSLVNFDCKNYAENPELRRNRVLSLCQKLDLTSDFSNFILEIY